MDLFSNTPRKRRATSKKQGTAKIKALPRSPRKTASLSQKMDYVARATKVLNENLRVLRETKRNAELTKKIDKKIGEIQRRAAMIGKASSK